MTRQKTRTPRPTRLPKRRKGPSDRPGSPVPSVSATREATQAFRFFDADARSTFPPASLGRSTRDTLPMPRTLRPPKPSRSFSPLFVDAIPDRGDVPLPEHVGRLCHAPRRKAALRVGGFEDERALTWFFDRTLLPERAPIAGRRRHLDPRR